MSHKSPDRACARRSCPGKSRHGPVLAIPRNRAVDDLRIERGDIRVGEALPLDHAGTEILDHDVGAFQKPLEHLPVIFVAQVGGNALLVAIDRVEQGIVAVDIGVGQIEMAAEVALAGPLDLDHPRAEVGELE